MKVRTRLLSGFALVIALSAAVAAVGIFGLARIDAYNNRLYDMELLGISYVKEANINLIYAGRARMSFALATNEQERQRQAANFKQAVTDSREWLGKAQGKFYTEAGKRVLADVERSLNDYVPAVEAYLTAVGKRAFLTRDDELARLDEAARASTAKVDQLMTELTKLKEKGGKDAADEGTAVYERMRFIMVALTAISVAFGLVLGMLVARSLTRQLGGEPGEVADAATAIAAGDLSTHIDVRAAGEGSVVLAMHRMQTSLRETVGNVRRGVDQVSTASAQIAAGNQDLSSRTEEQASSLQQTAASMEQLTSTVKQSAENARQASQLAGSASEAAQRGGAVVDQVVTTMNEITGASRKIADIIGVIDGIAFQTNILALNAAVEAARAGEQGRGFAVVAGEVRTLAQRSSQAAKEIRGLISASVGQVEEGSRQVNDAGTAMAEIVQQVKRVTDLIQEISSAALEQSSGITQINDAVTQMDQVTQQNAALVEESAAAASSLRDQASRLAEAVAMFRLSHDAAAQAVANAQLSSRGAVR